MEFEKDYIDAIKCVNECILNDDRDKWWPNIIRIEGEQKIHSIDGIEAGSMGTNGTSFDDAHCNSLLRLISGEKKSCTLFVYDVKCDIQLVDIIVGFLDNQKNLTLAWNNKRVFPMIGANIGSTIENGEIKFIDPKSSLKSKETTFFTKIPEIPENTKWIVAASLDLQYRKAVALFGRTKSLPELKKITPELN
jgi:hypothetical protein